MLNLLLSLAVAYALICIGARVLHRRFVYLPNCARCAPEKAGLIGVQEIVFKATDGVTLIAWYLQAKNDKPTILYFIGNNGRTASRADKIRKFSRSGYGVFMLNYRRYGGSEGWPSEAKNIADAAAAYDQLRARGVAPSSIIAYGESLGSAVATHLALQRPVRALVLEAPFTSAVDVGRQSWWMLPLGLIMADQYRTLDRISEVRVPVFLIHGSHDDITPVAHARRLYAAANHPKRLVIFPKANHNDLYGHGAWEKLRASFEELAPRPVRAAHPLVEIAA
jgi:uncharacterized protein